MPTMESLLRTRPARVEYARQLGLDTTRIRSEGFIIETIPEDQEEGKPTRYRVHYRTEAQVYCTLTTTLRPTWF